MVAGLIAAAGVQLIHERTNALIWIGAVMAILPLLARRRWPVTVALLATAGDLLVWSQWVHLIGDAPVATFADRSARRPVLGGRRVVPG
jgi:hypothetical protein